MYHKYLKYNLSGLVITGIGSLIMPENIAQEPTNGKSQISGTTENEILNSDNTQGPALSNVVQQPPTIMDILKDPEAVKSIDNLMKSFLESYGKIQSQKTWYSLARMFMVFIILALVTAAAAALSYFGKLDGTSLMFFFGTVVGSVITFMSKIEIGK